MKTTITVSFLFATVVTGCGGPTERDPGTGQSPDSTPADTNVAAPMPFAGCVELEDVVTDTAEIKFGRAGLVYEPKCARVRTGQTVVFSGNFTIHPLEQVFGPVDGLLEHDGGTSPFVVRFDVPGRYGYFCSHHGTAAGEGMAGLLEVVDSNGGARPSGK